MPQIAFCKFYLGKWYGEGVRGDFVPGQVNNTLR